MHLLSPVATQCYLVSWGKKKMHCRVPGIGGKSMIEYEEVDLQLSQFLQKATTTLISPVQKSLFFFS